MAIRGLHMTKAKRQGLGKMFSVTPETVAESPVKEKRPDRVGRKMTIFQIPEAAKKQLAILSIEIDRTQQDILSEALNDLFKKYNKPPIA